MDPSPDCSNMYEACDSSTSSSTQSTSKSSTSMSTATNSSRSTRSQHTDQVCSLSSIVPNDAKHGAVAISTEALISPSDQYQEGSMLMSPPAEDQNSADSIPHCTGCKSASPAVANCFSCTALLCANCVIAHQLMVAFEGHNVTNLGQGSNKEVEHQQVGGSIEAIRKMVKDSKKKLNELHKTVKSVDYSSSRLTSQYDKAIGEVTETFNFYMSMLAERKLEVVKELDKLYSTKQVALSVFGQKIHESTDKIDQMVTFIEKLLTSASRRDVLLFQTSLETRMAHLVTSIPQLDLANTVQLEFISNFQAIQVGVRNQFGYIKSGSDTGVSLAKQPPISRPVTGLNAAHSNSFHQLTNSVMSGLTKSTSPIPGLGPGTVAVPRDVTNAATSLDFQNNFMAFAQPFTSYGHQSSPLEILENLSLMASGSSMGSSGSDMLASFTNSVALSTGPTASLATPVPSAPIVYPPKAQIRRQKMIYHCKFGEFGILEGQFTEPSGVAVTEDNEIIVADTNNHRIQVFDKDGNFKFQFGEVGKRDGQLLYPNRVAVVASSGDIVVTERSPTHQVQIFTKFGHFIRKFGADVLQHPGGVATDCWGRIIVVECKVMRVVIFDMMGNLLNKFSCSQYLEFPNGVVVNDQMEIFISDNRAHCVKVFDYQGNYLRQIGGEGVSNFPIGVGITASGEITIADNHNNFNLTVFSQAGQLLGALESKVKHAQCFDVALMKDGSIVLASKDYRLYIYRYVKIPNLSL
eukprot:GFUD01038167.1.p1 GENE.GFUD01038167.1~~GFUD01038167.1.p1  ORF type:complete len:748 (-),score=147.61 GFUD01038167.1:503-2746(-)